MASGHLVADAATLAAARDGDRDALGQLWRIYQPQILRFLRARRCPSPDDAASQVWIDVGRAFAGFDGDGRAFQRWVFTIARNRSIDEIRRAKRRGEAPLTDDERPGTDGFDRTVDATADPAADIGSLEWALAQIDRLPTDQAEAVMLRVIADLSVTETAMVMGHSENNVRVLVHRGLIRLRSMLTAQQPPVAGGPTEEIRETCNGEHSPVVSQT